MAGAGKVKATVEDGRALARFTLKGTTKKAFDYYFQSAYTTTDGKSAATQPVAKEVNFGAPSSAPRLDSKHDAWETVAPKDAGFTVDVPVKPTQTRNVTRQSAFGAIRMYFIVCETKR